MRVPATPTEIHDAALWRLLSTGNQVFPQFSLRIVPVLPVFVGFLPLWQQFWPGFAALHAIGAYLRFAQRSAVASLRLNTPFLPAAGRGTRFGPSLRSG
jgi:hypothetical protein